MLCKECNVDLRIVKTKLTLENDDTAEEKTRAFREYVAVCRNPRCSLKGIEQISSRKEVPIG